MWKVLLGALLALGLAAGVYAMPPLSIYGNLPSIERAAISPSGKHIALVGMVAGKRRLLMFDAQFRPLLDHEIDEVKLRDIRWIGDDRVLAYTSDTSRLGIGFTTDKAELSSGIVVPLSGAPIWRVFDRVSSVMGGVRSSNGIVRRGTKWLGYFGGITLVRTSSGESALRTTSPDLYEVDLHTGRAKRVAQHVEGDQTYRDWLVTKDGRIGATMDYASYAGNWRIKNADGTTIASGQDKQAGIALLGFGPDDGTILYLRSDYATGEEHWLQLPMAGGSAKPLLADVPVREAYFDRDRRLIGYMRTGDAMETHFFDPRHDKVVKATRRAFPGLNVALVDYDETFARLIVKTDGPGDAGTWWLVDIATGAALDIGATYALESADVGPMRMVAYKAADGLAMEGVLTLPPGRDPKMLPVIMLPHGGPSTRDHAGFDWWAQAFASRGYAVFQPNFRGSTGYGAAFEKAGAGQWGRKMQSDISDGLAELVRQKIVDPARACIVGASYGGYAALAGVTLQQGLYKCAVSVAGVSDVAAMYRSEARESGYNRALLRALAREVGSGSDLKAISPIGFAERADAPILLIHGTDDTVVRYAQSTAMQRALKSAGKPVEMVTLPGEDHWLSKGTTRLAMLQAAIDFVQVHNPPGDTGAH